MTLQLVHCIEHTAASIREHADELSALDRAIGDGDHGINMTRGFDAVAAMREELASLAPGEALQKTGMTLIMKVGGASGPLYGSFFMELGRRLPVQPTLADLAAALAEGVAVVKRRGKSDVGDKTMLDVLGPVADCVQLLVSERAAPPEAAGRIIAAAESGLEATRALQAKKGRASYLGERSIGHLDPGAMSGCLIVRAACECLGGRT